MMNQVIVFKNDKGGISVIHPSKEIFLFKTIEQVARKDVPPGKPYAIVDIQDLPSDRTFRDAWEIDDMELVDGVGNNTNKWDEV